MHGRILIVDGAATNRIIHKVRFSEAFYEALLASDGAGCMRIARAERPDLILLDSALPDVSGTEVLMALRADPLTRTIPIITLSSTRDPQARLAALKAGADDVLSKPISDTMLMARVRNLMRGRSEAGMVTSAWGRHDPAVLGLAEPAAAFERAGVVGLVTARPETALGWKHHLQRRMRDTMLVLSREQALALPPARDGSMPDVFVIEADLDDAGAGLRTMSELKSHAGTRHATFCVVATDEDGDSAAIAFDLGADDVVAPGVSELELEQRLRTLMRRKRQADQLRATLEDGLRMAMIDPLTNIYNRRYAMPRLAGIAAQARSEDSDFAVMVVDLDRFKTVNDRHGHAAGDAVLVEVARRLTEGLRLSDLLARIGGEEFLVALPQTGLADAERVAERLRQVISDVPVRLPSGDYLRVTVSIGVAVGHADIGADADGSRLVEQADQALRSSKTAGRNVVTFSQSAA